jgi:hypothetical protein
MSTQESTFCLTTPTWTATPKFSTLQCPQAQSQEYFHPSASKKDGLWTGALFGMSTLTQPFSGALKKLIPLTK